MEQLKNIMQNKPLFYGIVGAIALILLLSIVVGVVGASKNKGAQGVVVEKVNKEPLDLLTTDNIGKAIEIQALLAREGLNIQRRMDGTKSTLFIEKYTQTQRDRALLAIVRSGLVDEHTGLEIFDKGDFTSTKEDKRIRLIRAINGELSRLIRKIPPIENAQVFISIPEQTLFTSNKKPITATVQLTVPSGEKLDAIKIKAVTNLLMGSVQGLEAKEISITDTNGNVYNSIIGAEDDMLSKMEENDKYMQAKVSAQLDKLIGAGNYVVTVSTFLTQAPVEKTSLIYNPEQKAELSQQHFVERLGDQSSDSNKANNAISVYLPYGTPGGNSDSSQNRSYARTAAETQFGVSKTQINEYQTAGTVEEISIAVSMDESSVPMNMSLQDLKTLIARSASPKVNPDNVSIAFTESSADSLLASDRPVELPKPEESGNPWWVVAILLVIGLGFGLKAITTRVKQHTLKQEEELEMLRQKAYDQDKQIEDVNLKAAELIQRQAQMAQALIEQQQQPQVAVQVQEKPQPQQQPEINDAISEISSTLADSDDEVIEQLKSWIEKS